MDRARNRLILAERRWSGGDSRLEKRTGSAFLNNQPKENRAAETPQRRGLLEMFARLS